MSFEEEMKKVDPCFKGFYHEERYLIRFYECIKYFGEIMSQVPEELENQIESKILLEVDEEEVQLESSAWAQGGRKKKKMIEIPPKAKEKDL